MAALTADMHYGIWVLTDEAHRLPSANVGAISERLWPECLGCFPHGWHKSALSAALRQTELVESAAEPVGERNQKRKDRLEPVAVVLMISLMKCGFSSAAFYQIYSRLEVVILVREV